MINIQSCSSSLTPHSTARPFRRAQINCDIFVLMKRDLDQALSYYPHIEQQIQEVAGARANLVKKRSEIAKKAAAEGKSAADAAKAAAQVRGGGVWGRRGLGEVGSGEAGPGEAGPGEAGPGGGGVWGGGAWGGGAWICQIRFKIL